MVVQTRFFSCRFSISHANSAHRPSSVRCVRSRRPTGTGDQGFESRSLPRRVCELLVPERRSPNLPLVQTARADLQRLGSRSTLSGVHAFDVITLLSWPGSAFPRFLGAEARQVGAHRCGAGAFDDWKEPGAVVMAGSGAVGATSAGSASYSSGGVRADPAC
jgi:hypothetical protein